jgi:hypothetical protein
MKLKDFLLEEKTASNVASLMRKIASQHKLVAKTGIPRQTKTSLVLPVKLQPKAVNYDEFTFKSEGHGGFNDLFYESVADFWQSVFKELSDESLELIVYHANGADWKPVKAGMKIPSSWTQWISSTSLKILK